MMIIEDCFFRIAFEKLFFTAIKLWLYVESNKWQDAKQQHHISKERRHIS
jgi:hypothetical protein